MKVSLVGMEDALVYSILFLLCLSGRTH